MRKLILILFTLISVSAFGQTQISGSRIKDGTITTPKLSSGSVTQDKLSSDALRPADGGTLSNYELTFGPQYRKKYSLTVSADIALILAESGNTADSYIFIETVPDGIHTLSFPTNWKYKNDVRFEPTKTQRLELYYTGTTVYIEIFNDEVIVISELILATIPGGTDDVTLAFSDAVNITTAGWTVTASGGAVTVSSVVSGNGSVTVVFDLSRNITAGEDMTISYNPSTGNTTSLTGNEIAAITNLIVDTGEGAEPENVVTVGPSGRDYTTIQEGSNAAVAGQTVLIDGGTYRETIIGKSGVTYKNRSGETVIISGLEPASGGWTAHDLTGGKSIYKKTVTLPVNGFQANLTSNTTIVANQVFKDGEMQIQARYPNITSLADMIDRSKFRNFSQATIGQTSITDTGLPNGTFTGAYVWMTGWFISESRPITSHTTNSKTFRYSSVQQSQQFRHWYYIVNDLELLDAAMEWHYEGGVLYFWQTGGGSPTGVEFKARNWGFDLRGKDNVQIIGLTFIGCEPATGDTESDNNIIDNIRAKYTNHAFLTSSSDYNSFNAKQTGIKLIGLNNTIKNSEFQYVSCQGIWAGEGAVIDNNLFTDHGWEGNYAAFVTPWGSSAGNITITNNTAYNLGRSAVDYGRGTHLNIEIGYNHFHTFSKITSDVGALYGCCGVNITGTEIHHNWIHDNMVAQDWRLKNNGVDWYDGTHVNLYFDQGSGTSTIHHNVLWNGSVADYYSEITHNNANPRLQNIYNNTFASTAGREAYLCKPTTPSDVQRNNIYRHDLNINWQYPTSNDNPNQPGDVANSLFKASNPLFVGSGDDGLAFRLQSGSPARSIGMVIAGITDDDDSSPDAGAYVFGGEEWVAGYGEAAAPDEFVYIEDNNTTFTTYSAGKTTFSNPLFSGGTASFFNTVDEYVTINITGTGFEWYAEKYNHAARVEVKIDGVTQDCDTGTGGTQNCDLYQNTTTNNSTKIFEATGLSAGAHTIQLKIIDKNASSTGYFLNHDLIKVTP